ncbi:phage integrase family protein [Bosea sp. BIWAKO-01]|nr:phage integrase family protein [Bosea sp. BIWAKO-01]
MARQKALVIRDRLANGEDPRGDKPAPKITTKPKTFYDCMEALLESKAEGWRNSKHKHQWEMTLRDYAKPLHDMPIADIALGDVKECLLPHWHERPETADRLRMRIRAVIDYGIAHEWRKAGNPALWRGLLDKVMPARKRRDKEHHAALNHEQAAQTVAKLRQSSGTAARAVEFLALTVGRAGEVRGARFDEIDIEAKTWTVPGNRMKAGLQHVVPLTDRALQIVEARRQQSTCALIFEGGREDAPVSDTAMTKALRLASPDKAATLHGWRSTFRDWAGDETEHPREIIESALAHSVGNETERAYRRLDALQKRRKLMEDWDAYCAGAN